MSEPKKGTSQARPIDPNRITGPALSIDELMLEVGRFDERGNLRELTAAEKQVRDERSERDVLTEWRLRLALRLIPMPGEAAEVVRLLVNERAAIATRIEQYRRLTPRTTEEADRVIAELNGIRDDFARVEKMEKVGRLMFPTERPLSSEKKLRKAWKRKVEIEIVTDLRGRGVKDLRHAAFRILQSLIPDMYDDLAGEGIDGAIYAGVDRAIDETKPADLPTAPRRKYNK